MHPIHNPNSNIYRYFHSNIRIAHLYCRFALDKYEANGGGGDGVSFTSSASRDKKERYSFVVIVVVIVVNAMLFSSCMEQKVVICFWMCSI